MSKRFKKIYIEISNVCNLQCTFCPEVERGKKFMEAELFRKVATQASYLTDVVCFHLMGEPLLHPKFSDYLDICGALGLRLEVTTNGVLLDEKRTEALLKPMVAQVNFSLQSFGDNFPERDNAHYLQNIFFFTQRALTARPDLYVYYRLWNEGAAGAPAANNQMFEKIREGLQVDFPPEAVHRQKAVHLKGRVYMHLDVRFEWPHPSRPVRGTKGFCYGMSSQMGILADGTVVPCCLDKEGVINLGNCGSKRLDHLLSTPRAKAIREGFKNGILVEDLCQRCTYIERFDGHVRRIDELKKRQRGQS